MRACLLSPSPSCSSSMRGPSTRWNGNTRQNVARPMHRSLGSVEKERRLAAFAGGAAAREGGGRVSRIWKDKHTVGMEVGKGEGGDGDEVGVAESPSVCSASSLGNKGVRGGTSSTSTSE